MITITAYIYSSADYEKIYGIILDKFIPYIYDIHVHI